jgi:hypothetical protein
MREPIMSLEFWKFAIPLVGAIVAWILNERSKRAWEHYQRKETNYKELLRCLRGFYVDEEAAKLGKAEKLKGDFLDQLNQCWLYCPDEVIKKGYAFLDTVHTNKVYPDSIKEKAMGDFVAAIREDLFSQTLPRWTRLQQTNLTGDDFRHLRVNRE